MWRSDGRGLWYWDEGRRRRRYFREIPTSRHVDDLGACRDALHAAFAEAEAAAARSRRGAGSTRPPGVFYSSRDIADRRLLDVGPDATHEEVRRAYRAKVKVMHPDQGGEPGAFRALVAAYERLSRGNR